jgi:hypothetical protein
MHFFMKPCVRFFVGAAFALFCMLPAGCWLEKPKRYAARVQVSRMYTTLNSQERADKYVVRGKGDQLFYLENLQYTLLNWDLRDNKAIKEVLALNDFLYSRGITFVFVPLPTKIDLYPECLIRCAPDRPFSPYPRLIDRLGRECVPCLDLYAAMKRQKKHVHLFPRTDTHWGPEAIGITAREIAARIENSIPHSCEREAYSFSPETVVTHLGDMGRMQPSNPTDTVVLKRIIGPDGYFFKSDPRSCILVCGDSFVRQFSAYGAGIDAQIAVLVGRPVCSYNWISGIQPCAGRIKRIVESPNRDIRVVVWVVMTISFMFDRP